MINKENDKERRQQKLADLFFEMGMDLDLIEKVSGIDKRKIILKRMNNKSNEASVTLVGDDSNMYVENKNSY